MAAKTNRREPNRSTRTGGTIHKSIGDYYAAYVDGLVNSGRYASVSEVLREALRFHESEKVFDVGNER